MYIVAVLFEGNYKSIDFYELMAGLSIFILFPFSFKTIQYNLIFQQTQP